MLTLHVEIFARHSLKLGERIGGWSGTKRELVHLPATRI